jgi:hypothetical protein
MPVLKLNTLGILNPVMIAFSYGIPLPDAARLTLLTKYYAKATATSEDISHTK